MSIQDRADLVQRDFVASWPKWIGGLAIALFLSFATSGAASAETRSLKLYFIHTKEKAEIVYKRNGRYDQGGLQKINRFLRDWRRNEPANMDPRLLDLVWEVYRSVGARDYIHVVSAYRSPATNAALRSRSSGVAEKSQHMLGKAMDFYIPGVQLSKLRAAAFKAEGGGVGYYPKSGAPFVHLDVGNVRSWPRMSRGELMALFPNGNTVHLPSDGKPLPGYKQALAAYESRKRSGNLAVASASSGSGRTGGGGRGLLAVLFGGGADEEEDNAEAVEVASAPARQAPAAQAAPVQAAPVETPETILASLPARAVPVPLAAPRPMVDVGAQPASPIVPGIAVGGPQAEQAVAQAEAETELALNVPLPSWRPADAPVVEQPAAQMAAADLDRVDAPLNAIAPELPTGQGSGAIADLLAMSAAEARADVVITEAPVPSSRPGADVEGIQTAALSKDAGETVNEAKREVFVLASLPSTEVRGRNEDRERAPAIAGSGLAAQAKVAALEASPRSVVVNRSDGTDAVASLTSGVRTTDKSARPRADQARADRQPQVVPVRHEQTRWALEPERLAPEPVTADEPSTAFASVVAPPSLVYTNGFDKSGQQVAANRFTGKAVTFLSVAKFATN